MTNRSRDPGSSLVVPRSIQRGAEARVVFQDFRYKRVMNIGVPRGKLLGEREHFVMSPPRVEFGAVINKKPKWINRICRFGINRDSRIKHRFTDCLLLHAAYLELGGQSGGWMDIATPSLNGLEATRQINARHLKSKVLILSCHDDEDYVQRSIDAGAVGYLSKQTTAHDLISAIREARKGDAFFSPIIAKRLLEFQQQASGSRRFDKQDAGRLTLRESEVLQLVAEDHATKQIAADLSISITAVERHRHENIKKLDIHDVAGLTRYPLTTGMIETLRLKEKSGTSPAVP